MPFEIYVITFISVIIITMIFSMTIIYIIKNRKEQNKSYLKRLERLSDVEWTQILSTNGSNMGSVTMYRKDGADFGTYSSVPMTKFLVVYFGGEREIVEVRDNSDLCKAYLEKLKTN